jgi:hypothetical protein
MTILDGLVRLTREFGLWPGISLGLGILIVILYVRTVPRDVYERVCEQNEKLSTALGSLGPTTEKLFEFVKLLVDHSTGRGS